MAAPILNVHAARARAARPSLLSALSPSSQSAGTRSSHSTSGRLRLVQCDNWDNTQITFPAVTTAHLSLALVAYLFLCLSQELNHITSRYV